MVIRPRTIISACGVGPDLHFAIVEASPMGVRTRPGPVVRDALHAQPEALRRAGASLPSAATVVFVCPAELTAARPIGVDTKGFQSARADLQKSIGRLVPIPPENAMIGLVQRHAEDGHGESAGFIYAARRDAIEAWMEVVRTITGSSVDVALAPAMALVGIGGQRTESLVVLERTMAGGMVSHSFRFGRATDIAQPTDSDRLASLQASDAAIRVMPSADTDGATSIGDPISPHELAVAGAMATLMGDGEFVPLTGSTPRSAPRWVGAAAALIAAGVLAWGASAVRTWRYERAIDRLAAEESELDASVAQVQAMRAEAARLATLLRAGVQATTNTWTPRTGDLAAAMIVVPEGGYIYRMSVNATGITLEGEAPRASSVLAAMENSPRFANARPQDPTIAVHSRDTESFGIRAEFETSATPAQPTGGSR